MKTVKTLFGALSAVALLSVAGFAQQAPLEPDFNDVFFRLDAGKLIPLEQQLATIRHESGGIVVTTVKGMWVISGSKSSVRFAANQALDFVVRSPNTVAATDPSTVLVLRKFESKRNHRELVYMTGYHTPIVGSTTTNLSEGNLPVTFVRYGSGSIKITTPPLAPGEYVLTASHSRTLYCFGVD